MEVASAMDFHFSSPSYLLAPSTPKRMGEYYFSAPTTPARLSELDRQTDQLHHQPNHSPATVPFAWEEKPGIPKSSYTFFDNDFAFDNTGVKAAKGGSFKGLPSSRSRRTKSLCQLSDPWAQKEEEEEEELPVEAMKAKPRLVSSLSTLSATLNNASAKGSRKWCFKDLFLFRSASDGRAMDRDPLKKYSAIVRKHDEDFRKSSFIGSVESGWGTKRRGRVSAHELHYTVNRAVSNDMKKKTFLPYKQGILGRLAFNPTVHALSNGFGFSNRN